MTLVRLVAFFMLAFASSASAQDCFAFGDDFDPALYQAAAVKDGVERAQFFEQRAYLVAGDPVVVENVYDASACVAFVNQDGRATYGLISLDDIGAPSTDLLAGPQAFTGAWVREEAEIIVQESDAAFIFSGQATFGANDPERVNTGRVNSGEFAFVAQPQDATIAATVAGDSSPQQPQAALGFGEGDEYACRLQMAAVGDYLVVKDNMQCGGMNVSFTGVYRRKPAG